MHLTNDTGLPRSLVRAIANDSYDSGWSPEFGDRYVTATQLVRPPQLNRLIKTNYEDLSEDAADRIYSLIGQSTHVIIERAAKGHEDVVAEKRYFAELDNWTISGQGDLYETDTAFLVDFKITSTWAVIGEMKTEWDQQLNILAWLMHKNGVLVLDAAICAVLRDWSKHKAKFAANGDGYPRRGIKMLHASLWEPDVTEAWIRSRLKELEASEPRECSNDERWASAPGFAAKRVKNKRASKIFESREEADAWVPTQKKPEEFVVEERLPIFMRCEEYCIARQFCQQAAADSAPGA